MHLIALTDGIAGKPADCRAVRGMGGLAKIGRMAAVLLCLVAFLYESLSVQTHVHLDDPAPAWAAGQPGTIAASLPNHDASGRKPVDCPICRHAAQSGFDLLVGTGFLLLPLIIGIALFGRDRLTSSWRERLRDWRSRGPPHLSIA